MAAKRLGWVKSLSIQYLSNAWGSMSQTEEKNKEEASEKDISPFKETQSLWWCVLV